MGIVRMELNGMFKKNLSFPAVAVLKNNKLFSIAVYLLYFVFF
jgi:hypothetical protein